MPIGYPSAGDLGNLARNGRRDRWRVFPIRRNEADPVKREGMERALQYMGLNAEYADQANRHRQGVHRFMHQLAHRGFARCRSVLKGRQVAANVKLALVVPGSGLVKRQAEAEGLDKVFIAAGFEWREPGCSMCLAMNADRSGAGRALRFDIEPQFRRAAGARWADPSGESGDGGSGGDRRAHFADVRDVL